MTDTATIQAEQLAELLSRASLKLVVAESCTGGGLSEILTRIPGSSDWFDRGFVTYSNDAKIELLHVERDQIEGVKLRIHMMQTRSQISMNENIGNTNKNYLR